MRTHEDPPLPRTTAAENAPSIPRHLGIILDGNRRWARRHGLPTIRDGHCAGFGKIPDVLTWCEELGIEIVTLWMLSDDNIARRSAAELQDLYAIDEDVISKLITAGRWRLHHIGRTDLLPGRLVALLHAADLATRDNEGMLVNLALAYGGRSDILTALQSVLRDAQADRSVQVTEEQIARRLSTAGQPDPDLVIRPSGELRTSGFLLWQAALTELYFCDRLWPDFTRADLLDAVRAYGRRQRRFGA
ncbi:polyprenyl diphosphate synthase [Streptomyces celluloflavus]|uniref:polyprenyl diphosphate synthase n=1 Tax=Streptomyces celluloflavus TaxID=58344 RepID=UPI0036BC45CC